MSKSETWLNARGGRRFAFIEVISLQAFLIQQSICGLIPTCSTVNLCHCASWQLTCACMMNSSYCLVLIDQSVISI